MILKDKDINIGYDDLVNCWFLEAFGVKQYLNVPLVKHPLYGEEHYVKNKRKNFLSSGKRAKEILNQRLNEMEITDDTK
jgi:hypothetical protein